MIDVNRLAEELAIRYWKENYESRLPPSELYNEVKDIREAILFESQIRDEYASIFWGLVDEKRELILSFKSDTNEGREIPGVN